ncbi:MAG: ATP-binding protein [Spirochaetes bacterium]|nr:ATP-binding protein [Spirochaetota bacterium]
MAININKQNNKFNIRISENINDIRILRNTIEAWLEETHVDEFKIMCVNICLMEAVYNGFTHGYKGISKDKKILDITLEKSGSDLKMSIQDHGKKEWFKSYTFPPVQEYTSPPTHGIGLVLIKHLSKSLKVINSLQTGTKVQIVVSLK